jgi:hypothetical protein
LDEHDDTEVTMTARNTETNHDSTNLEGRVGALEVGLQVLTQDVRSLAASVCELDERLDKQFQLMHESLERVNKDCQDAIANLHESTKRVSKEGREAIELVNKESRDAIVKLHEKLNALGRPNRGPIVVGLVVVMMLIVVGGAITAPLYLQQSSMIRDHSRRLQDLEGRTVRGAERFTLPPFGTEPASAASSSGSRR